MADNVEAASGSGGPIFATDDDGVAHHPYTKLEWGPDNTQTKVGTGANALPIQDGGNTITVDGTVTANLSTTDNTVLDTIATNTTNLTNCIVQDDAPFTPATGYLMMIGGEFDDAAPDSVDEGDAGNVRISANRSMYTQIRDAAGNERGVNVDANGEIGVTNSGTFATQAAQSGTWNITNVSGTVSLPTGAATAAKQPALGTAGTPSSDVITVQGAASMTALTVDGSGVTQPVSGTVTANAGTNLNTSALALESGGNLATVAGAVSGTEMQVDIVAALPAGTNAIGKLAANSGVDIGDVDVTSISAGSNLIGDVGISGARTSGGTTIFRSIDLDESEEQVKGTAGQIYWIHAMNLAASKRYLKVYNATAATVVVGTTTPVLTFPLATSGDTNGAGFMFSVPNGVAFGTAITVAATTGIADNDTGAPGANEVVVNIGYA